jgi:hypothetical protein
LNSAIKTNLAFGSRPAIITMETPGKKKGTGDKD